MARQGVEYMPGNVNKKEARRRLKAAVAAGQDYVPVEVAAIFFDLSTGTFDKWYKNEPHAPQPHRLNRRRMWRLSELRHHPGPGDGVSPKKPNTPSPNDPIMASIHAAKNS
jgi:hypothetical protein